jgi:16S rRNA (adenine1518-N6/adenine1519-N6)-dimethyltransferase
VADDPEPRIDALADASLAGGAVRGDEDELVVETVLRVLGHRVVEEDRAGFRRDELVGFLQNFPKEAIDLDLARVGVIGFVPLQESFEAAVVERVNLHEPPDNSRFYHLITSFPVIPARKRWGQHFLASAATADRIVAAARVSSCDIVLEVGPGEGALTRPLAAKAARLLAIEIDPLRAEVLSAEWRGDGRVRIACGDALEKPFRAWLAEAGFPPPAVMVANLPYNAATPILTRALEEPDAIARVVATVQREVAQRFVARAGSEHYGYLSVRAAAFARGRILFDLPPGAFRPRPKVTSSVLELTPRQEPFEAVRRDRALALASLGFRGRRKTLPNALQSAAPREIWERALVAIGKDPRVRAEELSIEDYLALAERVP